MGDTKNNIKTFFAVFFILVLGIFLRLIFIDKLEGLWNDEYLGWQMASIPLGKKFIAAIVAQCHMPLYYLYLKFFVHFFGNSDLMLRTTSVLTGGLSIIAMYFAGNELKDKKLGILSATLTAISSFLIYFSQEVRIYGILFLFSALSLIFTLRLLKKQNFTGLLLYIISNLLVIFTHTLGFIFVFFNLIFVSFSLRNTYKKIIISTWSIIAVFIMSIVPHLFRIFTSNSYAQWWDHFSPAKLGFLLTDYFSPILTNIVSSPDNFFYNLTLGFIIFGLIPTIIALIALTKGIAVKKTEILGLSFVSLAYLIVLIIAAVSGKLVFLTKYSLEIYPILIVVMGYGFLSFGKKMRVFLIFSFCFLNLFYIFVDSNSAPKMHRSEGHKIVAELLNHAKLHDGDLIVLNYYPQNRFEKYFDFSKFKVISVNKGNFNEYLGDVDSNRTIRDGKNLYREIFKEETNEHFEKKFDKEIVHKLKRGQKVSIVILNDVAIYTPVAVHKIVNDDKIYKKSPFLFLVFSQVKNLMIKESLATLRIKRYEQKGSWAVATFER